MGWDGIPSLARRNPHECPWPLNHSIMYASGNQQNRDKTDRQTSFVLLWPPLATAGLGEGWTEGVARRDAAKRNAMRWVERICNDGRHGLGSHRT